MNKLRLMGWRVTCNGLFIYLIGSLIAFAANVESKSLAGRRPNIILILTDDQGYGDLGRNGNKIIRTPNLDSLYDQSVRFEDFHVSPTCAPTRCSIFTGRHEFKSGVTHTIYERERMSLKAVTLAELLKSAGYKTGIFGKWHLGDEDAYQPGKRGFDEVFIHGGGGIGQSYPGSCGDAPGNTYFNPVILHNGTFEKTSGYCTDVFFNQAISWMDECKGDKPFFCYIATNAPHEPHQIDQKYEKMYLDILANDPVTSKSLSDAGNRQRKNHSQKDQLSETAKFLGMITNIDENIGHLTGKLSEWGIERDTLVIYMNDNGGTTGCKVFNAGMKGSKCTANNGGTRAMSLWRWPGMIEPDKIDALTAHIDLFPTLAALAGASIPDETSDKLEGRSLLPFLEGNSDPWFDDRMLFTHVGRWEPGSPPEKFGQCSVRWRQYLYFPSATGAQLYDLKADPGETADIVQSHPDVAAKMAEAYDQWWHEALAGMENEQAYKTAPDINPFWDKYWLQYQGPGPNNVPREETLARRAKF